MKTNLCVLFFTISLPLEEAATAAEFGNSIAYFPDFTVRYGLQNLWIGVYKTNVDRSFIRENGRKLLYPR